MTPGATGGQDPGWGPGGAFGAGFTGGTRVAPDTPGLPADILAQFQNQFQSGNYTGMTGGSTKSNDPFGIGMNPAAITPNAATTIGNPTMQSSTAQGSGVRGDPNAVPVLGGPVGGQFNKALWNYDPFEHLQGALTRMGYGGGSRPGGFGNQRMM